MSNEFTREDRYIVFKIDDLGNSLKGDEIRKLEREYTEQRRVKGKEPLRGLFIEYDWPEYEPAWRAIEARVTGAQSAQIAQDESVRKAWVRFSNAIVSGDDAPYPGMSEAFEQHFSQSFTDREWRAESGTWAAAWKATKRHEAQAQPAPSLPECPYPCGWRNLLKLAIEDGAYLARSINEDEPVTENARSVTMRMVMRLRDVLMVVNNAAPEAKP